MTKLRKSHGLNYAFRSILANCMVMESYPNGSRGHVYAQSWMVRECSVIMGF